MDLKSRMSDTRVMSLGLNMALHGMNHALFGMLMPLGLTLTHYFGFDTLSRIAAGFSLYLAFYGFGQIPIGFLSDRMSRKLLLGAGAILNGVAIAAAAFYPDYRFFLLCMAFAGMGAAAYHPVGASYLTDLFKKSRGSALGISGAGATVGLFLGPLFGGMLADAAGWRVTFMIFSAASIILGIVFIFLASEPEREKNDIQQSNGAWGRGIIIFLAIAAAIFAFREFAGWGGYLLIPIFCETIYRSTTWYAGLIGGLQSVPGFIAQPLGGWLSDRFGRRWLTSGLLFFAAVFMILIPFSGKHFLIPLVLLYGVAYTATVPIIDAMIADRIPSHIRGSVYGIFMAAGIGLGSVSMISQARIIDVSGAHFSSFVTCFVILGIMLLISMCFMLSFKDAEKPQPVRE